MSPSPLRVALTGGIATGKSHCLQKFAQLGVPVIDADAIAREVVAPGSEGLAAVVKRFGTGVLRQDGTLDRAALAELVFSSPQARRDLESLVHPAVYRRIDEWFASPEVGRLGIADVPLLFETGRQSDFDSVVVVACAPAQQLERLLARGLSAGQAQQRLDAQLPIDEKRRKADFVIDTSETMAGTDSQVVEVWEKLRALAARQWGNGGMGQ